MPAFSPAIEIIDSQPDFPILLEPDLDDLNAACSRSLDSYGEAALRFVQTCIEHHCYEILLPTDDEDFCHRVYGYHIENGEVTADVVEPVVSIFYDTMTVSEFSFSVDLTTEQTSVTTDEDFPDCLDINDEVGFAIHVIVYMILGHYLASTETAGSA